MATEGSLSLHHNDDTDELKQVALKALCGASGEFFGAASV